MTLPIAKEILINGYIVPIRKNYKIMQHFEFLINEHLEILHYVQLFNATFNNHQQIKVVRNSSQFYNILFELSHVRINPNLDNTSIINNLIDVLTNIGVKIDARPSEDFIGIYFKPLGDIKDNVRFYIKENNKIVFLASTRKLKLLKFNS